MKAYLVTTAGIFGLIAIAHVIRTIAEWSRLSTDSWFLLEGPGIGVIAAALCLWGLRVFRFSKNR